MGTARGRAGHGRCLAAGTGEHHHALQLTQAERNGLGRITFAVATPAEVDVAARRLESWGVPIVSGPGPVDDLGGGYGVSLVDPEGRVVELLADALAVPKLGREDAVPVGVTHVVLNTVDIDAAVKFYCDVLGMRVSDWSEHQMAFLRCNTDHHSIAFNQAEWTSVNHVAYEMPTVDHFMRGIGRLRHHGTVPLWGPGKHGPGDNTFRTSPTRRAGVRVHLRHRAGRRGPVALQSVATGAGTLRPVGHRGPAVQAGPRPHGRHPRPRRVRAVRSRAGVVTHVVESGSGPALLMLHGIGGSADSFAPQFDELSDPLRLLAWDAPGYGRSEDPGRPFDLDDYADAAADVIRDRCGDAGAHVLGMSWGGVIATRIALRHPDLVRSLLLGSSTVGSGPTARLPAGCEPGLQRLLSKAPKPLRRNAPHACCPERPRPN